MKVLVAYYSRTGVTRSAARAICEAIGASDGAEATVEEVVDTKPRKGTAGYMVAGKDAMLKRDTVIAPLSADVAAFDVVVIGTPVWAFTMAPAIRAFCNEHGASVGKVAAFCTMGGSGDQRTFKHIEEALAKPLIATLTLIDKRVKSVDEQEFVAKVKAFAQQVVTS